MISFAFLLLNLFNVLSLGLNLFRLSSSAEKLTEEKSDVNVSRSHNFQRKHFDKSTQCEFCGRKIWLKDGVQCRDCTMNCHKKCITKCQAHTICGPVDASSAALQHGTAAVEFKVTDADGEGEIDDFEECDEPKPKLDQHPAGCSNCQT